MISANILPSWFLQPFSVNLKSSWIGTAISVAGGLLGSSSKGSSKSSSNAPWKAQQPYLKEIFSEAQDLYNQGSPQYYAGRLNSGANRNLQTAFNSAGKPVDNQGFLQGLQGATAGLQDASNVYDQGLANQVADNPFLQSQVDSVARDVNQNASTQIAQNNMNAGMMGTTGSSGAAIQNALVQRGANDTISDASTALRSNAYNQGVNAGFQGAGNRMTSLGLQSQNNLAGLQTMYNQANQQFANVMNAGKAEYGIGQDSIAAELDKWRYNTEAPWDNLNRYRGMVQGNYGRSSTARTPNPSVAQGALGGALAGAGIWRAFSRPTTPVQPLA